MVIVTVRTDKPGAELGLFKDETQLNYETWQAHRQLAETIHSNLIKLLEAQGKLVGDIGGIVCYKGPGSFTGLRIGLSVANALAYSLSVPIVGVEGEDSWISKGVESLLAGVDEKTVIPVYGAPVHTTPAKR